MHDDVASDMRPIEELRPEHRRPGGEHGTVGGELLAADDGGDVRSFGAVKQEAELFPYFLGRHGELLAAAAAAAAQNRYPADESDEPRSGHAILLQVGSIQELMPPPVVAIALELSDGRDPLLVALEWRASSVQHVGHEEGLGRLAALPDLLMRLTKRETYSPPFFAAVFVP